MDNEISEFVKRLIAFTHPASFGIYRGKLILRRDVLIMTQRESPFSIGNVAMGAGDFRVIYSRQK